MIDTDDLIGVPWQEGGRDPRLGLDCLGAVLLVLQRMGLRPFDPWAAWAEAWRRGWRRIEEAVPDGWVRLREGEGVQPGDVMITQEGAVPSHIVIVLEERRVLSAMKGQGVVLLPLRWAQVRMHSAWRCEG